MRRAKVSNTPRQARQWCVYLNYNIFVVPIILKKPALALAVLTFLATIQSSAQDEFAATFAKGLQRDTAVLASRATVDSWRRSQGKSEKLRYANYGPGSDGDEVEFLRRNRWCATSVSEIPGPATRAAAFYVPSVALGALNPLPDNEDPALRGKCPLQAIWYEIHARTSASAIVRELSASWGQSKGTTAQPDIRGLNTAVPIIRGIGNWKNVVTWNRPGFTVWIADDPGLGNTPRVVAYARRNAPKDWGPTDRWGSGAIQSELRVAEAAAQIAAMEPGMADTFLSRSLCQGDKPETRMVAATDSQSERRLARWLEASKHLVPQQRAAAFLLADLYVVCASGSSEFNKRLIQLGVEFKGGCPQDGPNYSHNYRRQAEELDPKGPAGELAGLLFMLNPCSTGSRVWPDRLIERGEKLLRVFPPDQWTPYAHYALARAYAARLSYSYPHGNPVDEKVALLSRREQAQFRKAAIDHFKFFIRERPDVLESVFSWQEAWRLLAGLPPSQLPFGCSCE